GTNPSNASSQANGKVLPPSPDQDKDDKIPRERSGNSNRSSSSTREQNQTRPATNNKATSTPVVHVSKQRSTNKNLVLDRYELIPGKEGWLGEGSFSSVRKARDLHVLNTCAGASPETADNYYVAVKTYKRPRIPVAKDQNGNPKPLDPATEHAFAKKNEVILKKFKRQIHVLETLLAPIEYDRSKDPQFFRDVEPSRLFLRLLDYSKDENGEPGPDPTAPSEETEMVVVTEMADFSLKDYLTAKQSEQENANHNSGPTTKSVMNTKTLRKIAHNFLLSCAVLHKKGLAHLDIKPENLMSCQGSWKLIDVDGCVPLQTEISINDSTISFSPCYCAPEWAHFLIEDLEKMTVSAALDVWSVGVSLLELIAFDAVLKPKYASLYKETGSHRKAGFLFLEWLSSKDENAIDRLDLIQDIRKKADPLFVDLVLNHMLKKHLPNRWSLAQCLQHSFFTSGGFIERALSNKGEQNYAGTSSSGGAHRTSNNIKTTSSSSQQGQYQNSSKEKEQIASGGYTSTSGQHHQRSPLGADHITSPQTSDRQIKSESSSKEREKQLLQHQEQHQTNLSLPGKLATTPSTSKENLGSGGGALLGTSPSILRADEEERMLVKSIKERRKERMEEATNSAPEDENKPPLLKGVLWKLNSDGDCANPEHWLRRDVWLSANGNLCYYSQKKNKRLILLDNENLARAEISSSLSTTRANAEDHGSTTTGRTTSSFSNNAYPFVIQLKVKQNQNNAKDLEQNQNNAEDLDASTAEDLVLPSPDTEIQRYACEHKEDLQMWLKFLEKAAQKKMNEDIEDLSFLMKKAKLVDMKLLCQIRNRRAKIPDDTASTVGSVNDESNQQNNNAALRSSAEL
ncbi:unnamed protein product, partial [Amoebophrya sp. A120]